MDTTQLVNPQQTIVKIGPREAAYIALMNSQRGEQFIALSLEQWKNQEKPSKADFGLAYEIASGATRRTITLDYITKQMSDRDNVRLRMKEKTLLRIGLYQAIFMDRIPMYAVVDETVNVAKKHTHETFVGFLNALLRKVYKNGTPILPMGDTAEALSIYYSYPVDFVQELLNEQGIEKTRAVLDAGNRTPIVMARHRPGFQMVILDSLPSIQQATQSDQYYIQNISPAHLMIKLAQGIDEPPTRFLDICAAPGGKLLAAHDLFPKAMVYANEPSEQRLNMLRQNMEKYRIPAVLSVMDGLNIQTDQRFDLVIVDVPCSNSGVLNKRPEARWRLNASSLHLLEQQQLDLLRHAVHLTKSGGEVWYLTCSILAQENQNIVEKVAHEMGCHIRTTELVLPNKEGWDGGFGCALRCK